MLSRAAKGLGSLKDEVAFVGGATIRLYLPQGTSPAPRGTDDVDCVVEVAARTEYHKLEERLRAQGLRQVVGPGAPICRWTYEDVVIDVMPTAEGVLSFSNRWYAEGLKNAAGRTLPDGTEIRVFTLPYLVATKLDAYSGRGNGDYIGSADIEDILTLADGAPGFTEELALATGPVAEHIRSSFRRFLADEAFLDSLPGHVPGTGRAARVRDRLEAASAETSS